MKEQLIALLNTFGYPVRLQGSLSKDEPYPETFFTFWNDNTTDLSHYNNDATAFVWAFSVYLYSTSPETVNTVLAQVRTLLKQNGWIMSGVGYDVPTDEKTHTGRAINVLYIQKNVPIELPVAPTETPTETTGTLSEQENNIGG